MLSGRNYAYTTIILCSHFFINITEIKQKALHNPIQASKSADQIQFTLTTSNLNALVLPTSIFCIDTLSDSSPHKNTLP